MANDMTPSTGKKNTLMVVIIAIVALLVIVLAVVALSQPKTETNDEPVADNNSQEENVSPEGDMLDDEEMTEPEVPEALVDAKPQIEGGDLVSKDNKVITPSGEVTKNDVDPMTPEAPKQTAPISEESVPATAVKVKISAAGYEPSEFTVSPDTPVTLSVTSADTYTHIFKFDDPVLKAVAVGVGPGETRAITFQTPEATGEYSYYCDVPGHTARGEAGVMIVQ